MKRTWISVIVCLLILASAMLPAYASGLDLVSDQAGLLSEDQIGLLKQQAETLSDIYGIDAAILTVYSLGGISAQTYADDYYDHMGFAEDGILFLLAMEEREWYITTSGDAIYAFTDYGLMEMEDSIVPLLSEGAYFDAFSMYLTSIPAYMDAWQNGAPIDGIADGYGSSHHDDVIYYEEETTFSDILNISAVVGLITAGISVLIMRFCMNTKRRQHSAGDYLEPGSFRLRTQRDIYLYSSISKVRKQQNTSNSGSSVHRSSSGRSHGGRGGKF